MSTAAYFNEKAQQCRRLSRVTSDERTITGLTALAEEFDAKATAAEAITHTSNLFGNSLAGSLTPDDKGGLS